jgi:hypothetical protein
MTGMMRRTSRLEKLVHIEDGTGAAAIIRSVIVEACDREKLEQSMRYYEGNNACA